MRAPFGPVDWSGVPTSFPELGSAAPGPSAPAHECGCGFLDDARPIEDAELIPLGNPSAAGQQSAYSADVPLQKGGLREPPLLELDKTDILRPTPAPVNVRTEACSSDSGFVVRGLALGTLDELDGEFERYMRYWAIPNAAFAVVAEDGRLVLARGYTNTHAYGNGELVRCADPTSVFRIASISKSFTAAAVMQLIQNGVGGLALTDLVADRLDLSPFSGRRTHFDITRVRIQDLLNHTGGWSAGTGPGSSALLDPVDSDDTIARTLGVSLPLTLDHIIDYMTRFTLAFTPGTQRVYSNYGYVLLGRLIETISGQSLAQYLKSNLWDRLGLSRASLARTQIRYRGADEVKYFANGTQRPYALATRWADSLGFPTEDFGVSNCTDRDLCAPYCCSAMGSYLWDGDPLGGRWRSLPPYGRRQVELGHGSGSMRCSAVDIAKWVWQFSSLGSASSPILSQSNIAQMIADPNPAFAGSYGYGWSLNGTRVGAVQHTGHMEGTSAYTYVFPSVGNTDSARLNNVCLAFLFNRNIRGDFAEGRASEMSFYSRFTRLNGSVLTRLSDWGTGNLFPSYGLP